MHLLLKITLLLLPLQGVGGLNYPPLGWNCRCTVVQVRRGKYPESDSEAAQAAGKTATQKTPAFRFNPGKEKKLFPENVSYLKHAGKNRAERDKTEGICERINQNETANKNKQNLVSKTTECLVSGNKGKVIFDPLGINHFSQDLFGDKKRFWIKNEILKDIDNYIKTARCIGKKVSDTNHNTNKKTLRLKKQTDYFYYFPITLPNGENAVLHLGRYNATKIGKEGTFYLYSITKNVPENIEVP